MGEETEDGGAASVWIPPGEPELSDEDEAKVEPLLRELVGSHADGVLELLERFEAMELLERFEANHPRGTPHF